MHTCKPGQMSAPHGRTWKPHTQTPAAYLQPETPSSRASNPRHVNWRQTPKTDLGPLANEQLHGVGAGRNMFPCFDSSQSEVTTLPSPEVLEDGSYQRQEPLHPVDQVAYQVLGRLLWDCMKCGNQTGNLKNIVGIYWEYKDPGRYIPMRFLLSSCGSLFGGPQSVPFIWHVQQAQIRKGNTTPWCSLLEVPGSFGN